MPTKLGSLMKRSVLAGLAIAIFGTAGAAQTIESASRFEDCAVSINRLEELSDNVEAHSSRLDYIGKQLDTLDFQIDLLDGQITVQEGLMAAQPNNYVLVNHYNNLFAQYNAAFDRRDYWYYNEYQPERRAYEADVDRFEDERYWYQSNCVASWSSSLVQEYCDGGSSRYARFCQSFD